MADTKISALTAASALAAADIAPVVQGGANVKATVQQIVTAATGSTAFRGETLTTSKPAIDLAQTWNASGVAFTGVKFNATDTASAANSLLMDLQVGEASKFSVSKAGAITIANGSSTPLTLTGETYALTLGGSAGTPAFKSQVFSVGGSANELIRIGSYAANQNLTAGIVLSSTVPLAWAPSATNAYASSVDITVFRDAAGTLAQRNGVNAQTFRLYGTFTDASNSRRLALGMTTGGVATIKPEGLGTGASGNVLHISGLPDSNPGPGILWNDAGTVKVGT